MSDEPTNQSADAAVEAEALFIRRAMEAMDAMDAMEAMDARNDRDLVAAPAGSIVVGDDGSDSARRALETALGIAEGLHAQVVVVQSWTIESSLGKLSDHGYIRSFIEINEILRKQLLADRQAVTRNHPDLNIDFQVVLARPVEALVGLSRDARMLVLGSRGLGRLGNLVLGSVGVQCLRRAYCPVLVVPNRTAKDEESNEKR